MAAVYQVKIKYYQDKLGAVILHAFDTISFSVKDKHVVNEYHVIQGSNDTTQQKCPNVVHFNVARDWFKTNSQ